ncbi:MAG TPA: GNAT family N-acetyltransferase [Pyrinomonadaceae bacterium]|nr:GNAT family N-acetyltransferase [Pyrinomonadaceae bacterium]
MNIEIRRAQPEEAETLTGIAHAAKRHWGYPEHWIAHWKPDLTITPDFISANEVFVAIVEGEVVGCCALVLSDSLAEIEHMWIKPEYMGAGVGRALFTHARTRAADLNLRELELSADPNAEGFYKCMGAVRIGEVKSEIDGQPRVLPRMKVGL